MLALMTSKRPWWRNQRRMACHLTHSNAQQADNEPARAREKAKSRSIFTFVLPLASAIPHQRQLQLLRAVGCVVLQLEVLPLRPKLRHVKRKGQNNISLICGGLFQRHDNPIQGASQSVDGRTGIVVVPVQTVEQRERVRVRVVHDAQQRLKALRVNGGWGQPLIAQNAPNHVRHKLRVGCILVVLVASHLHHLATLTFPD
mmetsp:Transcript_93542/g.238154  ORF Transcript_93542/g.238154 Transcript_93542/m.238154 type:complete len:201 (+) Transcript_93542:202-804(+)